MVGKAQKLLALLNKQARKINFEAIGVAAAPAAITILAADVLEEDLFLCSTEQPARPTDDWKRRKIEHPMADIDTFTIPGK